MILSGICRRVPWGHSSSTQGDCAVSPPTSAASMPGQDSSRRNVATKYVAELHSIRAAARSSDKRFWGTQIIGCAQYTYCLWVHRYPKRAGRSRQIFRVCGTTKVCGSDRPKLERSPCDCVYCRTARQDAKAARDSTAPPQQSSVTLAPPADVLVRSPVSMAPQRREPPRTALPGDPSGGFCKRRTADRQLEPPLHASDAVVRVPFHHSYATLRRTPRTTRDSADYPQRRVWQGRGARPRPPPSHASRILPAMCRPARSSGKTKPNRVINSPQSLKRISPKLFIPVHRPKAAYEIVRVHRRYGRAESRLLVL